MKEPVGLTALDSVQSVRRIRLCFRAAAVALGGLHAWAAAWAHSMSEDGISYLDIGDAFMQGEWHALVNPVWSPLYAGILGLVMNALDPPMRWEFPLVHAVNFVIYLGALACFEFFLRQLLHFQRSMRDKEKGCINLPEWALSGLAYSLFIWSSLTLIQIWRVTPDMLMAALVYLAAGLLLRIRTGSDSWSNYAALGAILGLGYLTKTFMLPLSLVFLGVSLFSTANRRRAWPRVLAALLIVLLCSAPFIYTLSIAQDRLSFGEAGKLTYVRYVNKVPYPHWQGIPEGHGTPAHPTRKLLDHPAVYEFDGPVGGTYPVSYDPFYWYEGVVVRFDLYRQSRALLTSSLFYFDLFFRHQAALMVGFLIFYQM